MVGRDKAALKMVKWLKHDAALTGNRPQHRPCLRKEPLAPRRAVLTLDLWLCLKCPTCPAASSFDFGLVALPEMSTVKLKGGLGLVPSSVAFQWQRLGSFDEDLNGFSIMQR